MRFRDRAEAGRKLATALAKYQGKQIVVYALPRGGVVLGAEIARALKAPLDLVIPRKIGHPYSPEYAIAAVTEDGELEANQEEVSSVDKGWFKHEVKKGVAEAKRRRHAYLKDRKSPEVKGKVAIVVDDGIATGLTMLAALKDIKKRQPHKLVVAIPVTPRDSAKMLREHSDELVALDEPLLYMGAVGAYYDEFPQVEDNRVINIVNKVTSK